MIPAVSVAEFINQINNRIVGECIVEGEVSQYKISQQKWVFFDLKDSEATLNCFSTVFMVRTPLEEGMKVRVKGYPKIHEKSGRFSFTVQSVELVGAGTLERAYQLLKKKLTQEGLFDAERKRTIPAMPQRIGVIASRDSAAWGDFKRILAQRWSGVEVVLRHSLVQGQGAVNDVVQAFYEFNEQLEACDVLVLIRGGGSLEDLAAFNTEEVVRAIFASKIPVVVGVGHERDETLADLASDVRASTPTYAAELVVPDRTNFIAELEFELEHINQTLLHAVATNTQVVDRAQTVLMNYLRIHVDTAESLVQNFWYSRNVLENKVAHYRDFITSTEVLLKNTNPTSILKRGFSITRTQRGEVVRSSNQVDKGEKIMIELATGSIKSEVL